MARQATQFQHCTESEVSFPISKVNLFAKVGDEMRPTKMFGILNEQSGQVYNRSCSDDYTIIPHGDFLSMVREAIDRRGMEFSEQLTLIEDGAKFLARYTFPGVQRSVAKVGDPISFRFDARNSLDLTWGASGIGGALRLACLNGMVSFAQAERSFYRKHVGTVDLSMIGKALDEAIAQFEHDIELFGAMAQVPLTTEQGSRLLRNLAKRNKTVLAPRTAESIIPAWENPRRAEDTDRTLWNVYNSVTEHMTHTVEPERFTMGLRNSPAIARLFGKLAQNADYREALLIPAQPVTLEVN